MRNDPEEQRHKPGVWKQQNKTHKHGKHRSKNTIDNDNKGRVSVKKFTKKIKQDLRRHDRRNQINQIRNKKREEIIQKKRGLGGSTSPPFIVGIIDLTGNGDTKALLGILEKCDDNAVITSSTQGYLHISLSRFKQRYSFVVPETGNLYAILDTAKVVDTVLFLWSADENKNEDDTNRELILTSLFSQGLPTTVHVVQRLEGVPIKKRNDVKKNLQKVLEKRFPGEKLHAVDKPQDALLVFHQIGGQKQRPIYSRDLRPHMIAEEVSFEPSGDTGTLKVTGYIRGKTLSVNRLVHIPGWGDFQMGQIDAEPDPHPLLNLAKSLSRASSLADLSGSVDVKERRVLARADPALQESLVTENEPDPMDGEQTWPTEEELDAARVALLEKKKVTKRVPKGTSDYQAAWIVDDDEEEDRDAESDVEGDVVDVKAELQPMDCKDSDDDESEDEDDDDYETITVTEAGDPANYDEKIDMDEEMAMMEKMKSAREHAEFPDEVDTPSDVSAKIRFQKYRGLQSFKTSPWDIKENLPADYSKIFQFANFKATKKRVLQSMEEESGAMPGWYVTIHVINVPKELWESYNPASPLVVYGMLPYEQKMSVVNMAVRSVATLEQPIKSKERLVFHVGYRRFASYPIFSQHTICNKHKYERFLPANMAVVASVFAPIMFPPASALVFKELRDGTQELVATGSVVSVNPDRVVTKRIVLSGHPFKIFKKSAVIRYMFFNRADISWFKPVELRTKYGRRGHIKEPLGTHGHMKCQFNMQLPSNDTVLMNLYKRVFPKWTFDPLVQTPPPLFSPGVSEDPEDGEDME